MKRSFKKMLATVLVSAVAIGSFGVMAVSSSTTTESRTYVKQVITSSGLKRSEYTLTQSLLDGVSSRLTFGTDDRKPSSDSSVVEIYAGGRGTGFIIDDNIIATAAHCIYDAGSKNYATSIKINLVDPDTKQKKSVYATEYHLPKAYTLLSDYAPTDDYALIVVDEDLSRYGSFSLGVLTDKATATNKIPVFTTGFPKEVNGITVRGNQYTGSGYLTAISSRTFDFNTDMCAGKSGGPMYVKVQYKFGSGSITTEETVVGICSGYSGKEEDDDEDKRNIAYKFDSATLQFYKNNPYVD